ncbi:MAG: VWA domain-containing protein [Bryobacteraceae bacterium]
MLRFLPVLRLLLPLSLLVSTCASAQDDAKKDDTVVFKSDVALTRVDAQVVDRDGRAVTGLQVEDFVLKVDGKVVPIRNFASEDMPIDILLLLDVSGSMGPHVQRIAQAAQQALNVLTDKDRMAIMIFDTNTRLRLPFKSNHSDVTSELNRIIRSERFNGGTRITRAMLDAAAYLQKQARPEARRAIVILTDDQTQDEEDEARVESALAHANAIMSFLQAPYEPPTGPYGSPGGGGHRRSPGTWGSGGTWGTGGSWPTGGGGIGIPGRGGMGGVDMSHTAGTATIAGDSGGDVMQISDASALEDTLARLRQRYALHYYLPEGSRPADQRTVLVTLSQDAKRRYQEAEVRYRRVYMAGNNGERSGPTVVTKTRAPVEEVSDPAATATDSQPTLKRKRVAVNEDTNGPRTVDPEPQSSGPQPDPAPAQPSPPSTQAPGQGWPKADPPNPPPN